MNKASGFRATAATGLYIATGLLGLFIHLITTGAAYKTGGFWVGIVAFSCPVFSEIGMLIYSYMHAGPTMYTAYVGIWIAMFVTLMLIAPRD